MTECSDLVARLKNLNVHTVGIQAPEGLKYHAVELAFSLKEHGFSVIISGDPCYGSCDLALETRDMADVLVHLGHAAVDDHRDVIYEYHLMDFDPAVLDNALPLITKKSIGLVTTIQHVHMIQDMEGHLRTHGIEAVVSEGEGRTPERGQVLGCCFETAKKTGAEEILFVGTGVFHPIGISLATSARVIAVDPFTGTAQLVTSDRMLRKRFGIIEKARNADRFGILLSTKSGQMRQELAKRLVSLSEKAVLVTINEVTPDQLMNLGFAAYVNTACPRLAYDDEVRFPAPVLTPQEFEILCGVREWEQYEVDQII